MDNSGEGDPNIFTAKAAAGGGISSINLTGFQAVNPVHRFTPVRSMEFQVPQGLAPGFYEFSATTLTGANRSALLEVINTPGTGMLAGSVSKSFAYLTLKAGVLDFHDAGSGELIFSRDLDSYGNFRMGHIPPGAYKIHFTPDQESVPLPLDTPWFPNATSIETAQTVNVAENSTTGGIHFFVFEVPKPPVILVLPEIINPVREGNLFSFDFDTLTGLTYTVEYASTPGLDNWLPVMVVSGDGELATFMHTSATASGFYRVRVAVE
jgi:hypothetical protein